MCGCFFDDPDSPDAGHDAGTPCDVSSADCPLADLVVTVSHEVIAGAFIADAEVTVTGLGTKPTGADGSATWEKIEPGTYDVSAHKIGHFPDPGVQTGVVVLARTTATAQIKLRWPELHMHLDNDRDGVINDDWDQNNKWEPGAGKKGAVILCNNDNDDNDAAKTMDWENQIVDTAADVPDIAPLYLRKTPPGNAFPPGWKAVLSVSDASKIRIFDKHAAGGREIIGPAKGASFDITDLNPDEHRFGMEGIQYPDDSFDGKSTLTLKVFDDKGAVVPNPETGVVRVSPWIMFHHACLTTKVYVVATADNADFRTHLSGAISGVPLEVADEAKYGTDRWMQDVMEPGFSSLPRAGPAERQNAPVTLRTVNDRPNMSWGPTDGYAKNELLGSDFGFTEATAPTIGSSLDSFGNLECSPPFRHGVSGKDYKFGRIVYGSDVRKMHPKAIKFLKGQKVQEPFAINTDWLIVGHVDEVMSFLPLKAAPHGFKVMLASPDLAVKIVKAAPDSAKLFEGIKLTTGTTAADINAHYTRKTVKDIKLDATFLSWQVTVQTKINDIKNKLKIELDLHDADLIDLPVLFEEKGGRYIAYTPGVVNMLVVTKSDTDLKLCIPRPFGPQVSAKCLFEEKVKSKLNFPGVAYEFIDDFTTYHMLSGEIHCGTNSQRKPPTDRWWWELEWV